MKFSHRICWSALVVATSAFVTASAQAGVIYELFFDNPTYVTSAGEPTYITSAGQEVTVSFSLRETFDGNSGTGSPQLSGGLLRGHIGIKWDNGGFFADPDTVQRGAGFTNTDPVIENVPMEIKFLQTDDGGGQSIQTQGNTVTMAMGSVKFYGPTNGMALTKIEFFDPEIGQGTPPSVRDLVAVDDAQGSFDEVATPMVYGSAFIGNPEPSTFVLSGMGVLGAAVVQRFRQRRAKKKQTVVA